MAILISASFCTHRPLIINSRAGRSPLLAPHHLPVKTLISPNVRFTNSASPWLGLSRHTHTAGNTICASLSVGDAGHDVLCTAAGLAGAYAWISFFKFLGEYTVIEQKLSRKIIHISTGILYVLIWPVFSMSPWSRYFALAIPTASVIKFLLNGLGVLKDQAFVNSISRGGTFEELLRGPLYYTLVLWCCTLFFWRESPVGMIALAIMCGGDGVADIVGRRIGGIKLPHNSGKSWAGSIAMFIFGFALSIGFLYYFSSLGYYGVDWTSAVQNVALISLVATVLESLPISTFLDDNISVPLASVLMGVALFPAATS
eukprot:c2962_g1_i1 orf=92-1036(+)